NYQSVIKIFGRHGRRNMMNNLANHLSSPSLHPQDLVKSHLMYAVREEVEVLKEQIKELIERNTQLEQENNLLKTLASPEQMAQFQAQVQTGGSPTSTAQPLLPVPAGSTQVLPSTQNSGSSA
uniref:TSC22 domain family protein 1 n=1 Tax=Seriola lalandi dorsalis TaxID=1841481 RepID=A0A3B4WRG6_SERLL